MNLKALIVLSSFIFTCLSSYSQLDSSKVDFYQNIPNWQSEMDEILFPADSYKEYILEIEVSALANTENLHFELVTSDSKAVILNKTFSKTDLMANYKTGSNILISLGNLEIINYEIFITQEKINKESDYVISKTIAQ